MKIKIGKSVLVWWFVRTQTTGLEIRTAELDDLRTTVNKKEKTCFNMRINKIFGGEDGENLRDDKSTNG